MTGSFATAIGLVALLAITGLAVMSLSPFERTLPPAGGDVTRPALPTESVPTQSGPTPTVQSTPAVSPAPPVASVDLRVQAIVTDQCGSEGGCAYYADLGAPGGPWRAKFASGRGGGALVIDEGLPSELPPGDYSVVLSSFVVSDVIVNNEPPAESLDATCSASFSVAPGQTAILVRGTFAADGCSVEALQADPPAAPTPEWHITVVSPSFPQTIIECRGAPPLTESECLAWAERLLNGPPNGVETNGRLVLTNRPGGSRCAANFYDSNGRVDWTAALLCPLSSAGEEIALWTASAPTMVDGQEVCRLALGGGELARHSESGLGVKGRLGDLRPIVWPFGYTARHDSEVAVLVDRAGDTVAREGDLVQFGGGLNVDGVFAACGGVEVVQIGS